MAIAQQEEVRRVLAPHEAMLYTIVAGAWKEWLAHPDRNRYRFRRTRANFVFEAMIRLAVEAFEGHAEVRPVPGQETLKFMFGERVLLRFKKGNARGVGSNIETQTVLKFIDPQISFLPDVHRVEVCYQTDPLGLRLTDVSIVARDRKKRVWCYPLGDHAAMGEVVDLPIAAAENSEVQVVAKRTKKNPQVQGE